MPAVPPRDWSRLGPVGADAADAGVPVDILKSGTWKPELVTPKDILQKPCVLRRILNPMGL